ncbi:MAG: DUF1559 domain-containing protein [Planctomycetaceae bacterium]|nr:DUF1559 domain-containing protein [Planctomycetaceae bacterium]
MSKRAIEKIWLKVLVASLLLVLVIAVVVYVVEEQQYALGRARRAQCQGNMKGIAVALAMYQGQYGSLPPAHIDATNGTRMHSWRTIIATQPGLNYAFPAATVYDFQQPWNGPHNTKIGDCRPPAYVCPSDGDANATGRLVNYFVIEGDKTWFPPKNVRSLTGRPADAGSILFAEARGLGVGWTEPRDLNYNGMSFSINGSGAPCISSAHPNGANVGMADASIQFINKDIAPEVLKQMLRAPTRAAGGGSDSIEPADEARDDALPADGSQQKNRGK